MDDTKNRTNGQPRPRSGVTFEDQPEPGLGQLLRELSDDATRLIRQEIGLARMELRDTASTLGRSGVRIAIAAAIGMFAGMALLAFIILGLGALLANYWLAALIVTVGLGLVAGLLAWSAAKHLNAEELLPVDTIETLKGDARWVKREAKEVTQELRG
jgi:uncharacterized membrane protein YqjE